ncbi:MAG: PCYCGC motif-containing (lipo)protein [Anaerolineales bacterium]|jgi:hypothetical protein|nr:PCYCGC motif-containing (lipo)protein [Anaerolineales bacterium]
MKPYLKTYLFLALWVTLSTPFLTSCGNGSNQRGAVNEFKMASLDGMPNEVRKAPAQVQQAYQFASANPEIMTQIPCYCGCGEMGHTSNYACYIGGKNADGSLIYDTHALGCSICVDITLDTMRLLKEGKSVSEIRAYVDQTYAQYGPSNMP